MKRRLLLSWIGHSDLRALAATLPTSARQKFAEEFRSSLGKPGDLGPTKTLLQAEQFDEIRLLSNYAGAWNTLYKRWCGPKTTIVPVSLQNPTDYGPIFQIVDSQLAELRKRSDWPQTELCLHLSPGTPAMTAVSLLLGKTRYPATFYETFGGKATTTHVPFDLTIDVLPELLRDPDTHWQHLATERPDEVSGFEDIAGDGLAIREAVGRAKRIAVRSVAVLLLGESGTGKETFAHAIHRASPRREKPFVAINCAALSRTLLESELFGHTKGAFTGAEKARKGAFELADGGTLFLDEVGECDVETQAKLLRVLQAVTGKGPAFRKIRPLGADKDVTVDVRIVAATNRDLHRSIQCGDFREDLYYRLATSTITLPPLRERKGDIPKIADRLLAQINQQFQVDEPTYQHKSLSASTTAFVKRHDWPGNVRQLYNVLVQAAVLADGDTLERSDIMAALGELSGGNRPTMGDLGQPLGDGFDLETHLNGIRKHYLQRAMEEAAGVKAQAAKLLGMKNYQTLDAQLKRLEVHGNWSSIR